MGVHYCPTPGFRWPFDCSPHSAQPPVLSPVEDGCQTLSVCPQSRQGSLVSLMDATPVQQYSALQLHILTSLLPHHLKLLAGPFQQLSSNALASLSLCSVRL